MYYKLNVKAIIIGSLVAIIASILIGAIEGLILAIYYIARDIKIKNFQNIIFSNISLMVVLIISGIFVTMLGGFIAGKYSPGNEIPNSIAVGLIGLLSGIIYIFTMPPLPLWYNILGFIFVVPLAYCGGLIAKRKYE